MPGYDGSYRASVLDTVDPMGEQRVLVQVPDVPAAESSWAVPEQPGAALPAIGDEVTVRFENGDETHPIWSSAAASASTAAAAPGAAAAAGYAGTYRGVVVDTNDPGGYHRVVVHVPDVAAADSMWASPEQPDAALPAVGDDVWVRFTGGDVSQPVWSGGSGGGQSVDGTHRCPVLSAQDPAGLGRLYVQVPGAAAGMWATPEHPLPAVGDEVTVHVTGDSAVWSST